MLGITLFLGTGYSEPQALLNCRISILRALQSPTPKSLFLLQMRSPCYLTMKQFSHRSSLGLCPGHSFHIPLEKASALLNHHHKSPQVISQVMSPSRHFSSRPLGITPNVTAPQTQHVYGKHLLSIHFPFLIMAPQCSSSCGHVGLLEVGSQRGQFVCSSF